MAAMITIAVKILRGKEAQFEVTESALVLSVKHLIAEEFNVPAECQRLVFKGKTLADSGKLCDYNIKHGTKVHLFVLDGGARKTIPAAAATATNAQSTLGMASTSVSTSSAGSACPPPLAAADLRQAVASHSTAFSSTPASLQPSHLLSSSSSSSASVLPHSLPSVDADLLAVFKETKLWTALDNVLRPHFRPEDIDRIKLHFFSNMHQRVAKLSLPELEEYAKTSFGV